MNCAHAVAAKKRRMAKISAGNGSQMTLGDVTSLNITTLEAGVKAGGSFVYNCVPPVAKVSKRYKSIDATVHFPLISPIPYSMFNAVFF